MRKIEIKKYLNFLGMDAIEKMSFKSCEICGNKNTKLIDVASGTGDIAKLFLEQGQIEFIPRALDGATTLLVQMTYLPVLSLGGERAINFWSFVSGGMASLAVFIIARRCLNENWSLLLTVIYLTTPVVTYAGGTGQVEIKCVLFVICATRMQVALRL